jgi:cytochrome c peroxidase
MLKPLLVRSFTARDETLCVQRLRITVECGMARAGDARAHRTAMVSVIIAALLGSACNSDRTTGPEIPSGDPSAFTWELPEDFPRPLVPADNPMSDAKVELGRRLFFDTRLSGNGAFSCSSCHRQANAFADAQPAVRLDGAAAPAQQHVAA